MRWVRKLARIKEINSHVGLISRYYFVGNLREKEHLRRLRLVLGDNFKIDPEGVGREDQRLIETAEDRIQWAL
jgi:hypothetical protein